MPKLHYGAEAAVNVPLNVCNTVGQARERAVGMGVPVGVKVRVNGVVAQNDLILSEDDEVEFVKATGSKSE